MTRTLTASLGWNLLLSHISASHPQSSLILTSGGVFARAEWLKSEETGEENAPKSVLHRMPGNVAFLSTRSWPLGWASVFFWFSFLINK